MPHDIYSDLFDEPAHETHQNQPTKAVPNQHPRITNVPYRLAIIGEAPGADETLEGHPFVGWSGRELDKFLSRFGILRDACFLGNVCQIRPFGNKIATFAWSGSQIQEGLQILTHDLTQFNPNVILCLGGTALHAFKCGTHAEVKTRKSPDGQVFNFPHSIGDWRGSFFLAHMDSPAPGVKCIAAYHPAACLRQYEWTPLLMMDIKRAYDESTFKELSLPVRDLRVALSFEETLQEMETINTHCSVVGTDIEGYWNNWSCISFAPAPNTGFIVPLTNLLGQSYWELDQEVQILRGISNILSNPKITKVWQNGLYDRFCTQFGYNIVVRGPFHDIMLKHWELYCELEKNLGLQASLYTKEPYYKTQINSRNREEFWRYCCTDSAVTLEIDQQLDRYLSPGSRKHYDFNLTLLNALLYMELRGIRYNVSLSANRLKEINDQIYALQFELNKIAGFGLTTTDKTLLRGQLRDVLCYKRDPSKPKAGCEEEFDFCMRILLGEGDLSTSQLGRIQTALATGINVKSTKQKADYLYKTLGLPEQRDPKTKSLSTDYEALLTLTKKSPHPSLPLIIDMTELRTRAQSLEAGCDKDGRIRGSYNEVGSETGRVTCGKPPTQLGFPLQTAPDENELKPLGHPLRLGIRDLLVADDDCFLAKCDLKGADGWTVGANLASLGDSTMLDDLLFGLKPASILCYARRHGVVSISGKSRAELNELCREVKKSDWDYFAYKQCIWGFCYLMGVRKAAQHVFNISEGAVTVAESDMQLAKDMLFRRYNISLWHKALEKRLFSQPYPPKLTSPSGHVRMFFGRRTDILGQALAHEPQSITTYATNQAVYRCWTDKENRGRDLHRGGTTKTVLRIEPLHQVHDEMLVQFKQSDTSWALGKIRSWFENPIKIAGIEVTIPFEGAYGTDWAMNDKSKVGTI